MERSRIVKVAAPLIIALLCLVAYQYGYESVHAEMASIKEAQLAKAKTLQKYMAIISEKPVLEAKLASLREKRKGQDSKIISGQTPSLAANTLEDTVKAIITGKGGSI